TTPDHSKFETMTESRWTLVMVIAWIAWRDLHFVTEQRADFRNQWSQWVFQKWSGPTDNGKRFVEQEGWFLEIRRPATVVELGLIYMFMRSDGELNPADISPVEAELQLRRKLSDGRLKAEGFNGVGDFVELPAREWSQLQLFQENGQAVL